MCRTLNFWLCAACILLLPLADCRADKLKTGDDAPYFSGTDIQGRIVTLDTFKGAELLVICFMCNDCLFSRAYEDRFIEFNEHYRDKRVRFVAISVDEQDDLPAMKLRAEEKAYNFLYVHDPSGQSAAAYDARVTPHLFVVKDGKIAYQGSFDDRMREPTQHYLVNAVDALLQGKIPNVTETKPFGQGIMSKRERNH